jgi:hypothetical protein
MEAGEEAGGIGDIVRVFSGRGIVPLPTAQILETFIPELGV